MRHSITKPKNVQKVVNAIKETEELQEKVEAELKQEEPVHASEILEENTQEIVVDDYVEDTLNVKFKEDDNADDSYLGLE